MNSFEAIYRRKSVRKYSSQGLSDEDLADIKKKIEDLDPLNEDIDSEIYLAKEGERVQKTFSGLKSKVAKVEAPYYLLGTSEEKEGYLVNMGFLLEGSVLYLTERKLGSCWLGAGLNEDLLKEVYDLEYGLVIMVAFGDSEEGKKNLREHPEKAKRKSLSEIVLNDLSEVPDDWRKIIDAVKMAPSALNSQPWRFYFDESGTHLFIKKGGIFKSLVRKVTDLKRLNRIDAGIALKHLEIAAENFSMDVEFEEQEMERDGMEYIISIV
ncbi:MAG: nitroreductase family protein [Thermoplasmata archaeon]